MNRERFVIGLIGERASGKGTFINIAEDTLGKFGNEIEVIKFSSILMQYLDALALTPSQENFSKISSNLVETFGEDFLAKVAKNKILQSGADVVFLDGIRQMNQLDMIREYSNLSVYITASPFIRYQRVIKRSEKVGDQSLTLEKFITEESYITESNIPIVGACADFKIDNSGSLDYYRRAVLEILKEISI